MSEDRPQRGPADEGERRAGPPGSGSTPRRRGRAPRSQRRPRGQTAENRSRPIYEQPPAGRGRGPRGPQRSRGQQADNRSRPIYGRERTGQSRNGGASSRPEARPAPALPANPREAALHILHAVDTRSAFSDRLIDGAHEQAGPREPGSPAERDQALLHELAKGTLRWRGRLDWALDRLVHIGLSQVQPWIKNILRLGAYQILFLDRVPAHAAVDESVKLAHKYGHPGSAGLVNSVLRRLAEEKDALELPTGDDPESLAAWGSHPLWLTERWLERFGPEDTRRLLLADNRPARVGLRVNRLRATREQLIERLAAEGVEAAPADIAPDLVWLEPHRAPGALAVFKQGWCTVQDESEALVARLVAPVANERVLDLCAAPGGKCTHLAELMGDEGEVWATEWAEARIPALEQALARLGTQIVHVVQGDGRRYAFPMPFDRVLVDAPCSGLGVLARRADARWRKGPESLHELPSIQLELLMSAGRQARPGGVLVYSVCSFEPEETTDVVERFLRDSPSFVLESAAGFIPEAVVDENGFMQVLPHVHGCDGAFAARFRRT